MLRTPRSGTLGYFKGSGGVGSTIPSLQYLRRKSSFNIEISSPPCLKSSMKLREVLVSATDHNFSSVNTGRDEVLSVVSSFADRDLRVEIEPGSRPLPTSQLTLAHRLPSHRVQPNFHPVILVLSLLHPQLFSDQLFVQEIV